MSEIRSDEIVRSCLGDRFVDYIDADMPQGGADPEEMDAYFSRNDAYYAQFEGPYRYDIDVDGAHVVFEVISSDGDDVDVFPRYRVRLVEADGSVWDGFYDSLYGAGHTDCGIGVDASAYDEIGPGCVPEVRSLSLRVIETEAFENDPDIDAEVTALYTRSGKVAYRGERLLSYGEDGEPCPHQHSTLSCGDSFLTSADYIEILNEGIALAKMGIDRVISASASYGGEYEGLDCFDAIDRSLSSDAIDFEGSASVFDGFRDFHGGLRKETLGSDGDTIPAQVVDDDGRAEPEDALPECGSLMLPDAVAS